MKGVKEKMTKNRRERKKVEERGGRRKMRG